MTNGAGVAIRGLEETLADLNRFGGDLDRIDALEQLGGTIVAGARGRIDSDSGALAGSITAAVDNNVLTITAATDYAGVINYGDPDRGIAGTGYLTDADNDAESYVRELEADLDQLIARHNLH